MTNKSILLIDDCLQNLKLTQFLLRREGFEVGTAENADQALSALEQRIPDMILMDIQLPGMDGLALTRHLRRDETLRDRADCRVHGFRDQGRRGDCPGSGMRRLYNETDRYPDLRERGARICCFRSLPVGDLTDSGATHA